MIGRVIIGALIALSGAVVGIVAALDAIAVVDGGRFWLGLLAIALVLGGMSVAGGDQ